MNYPTFLNTPNPSKCQGILPKNCILPIINHRQRSLHHNVLFTMFNRSEGFRARQQISKVALAAPPAWFPRFSGEWRGERAGWLCPLGQRTAGTLEVWLTRGV